MGLLTYAFRDRSLLGMGGEGENGFRKGWIGVLQIMNG